ncbi:MAG: ArsJ-associated glyceraldehyde-3-phosphate dehydrogenase [Granulosicoccus sp.]|nr:ArsJ-associated glyceraldehyde-3-phosphate dehydrogenase [Granulosicoccus sp.]
MTIKVGINGFGRMGKLGFRIGWDCDDYAITHINEPASDARCHAHLLEYDSIHGHWPKEISAANSAISVDSREVTLSAERDPRKIDWAARGVDLVVECSGQFKKEDQLKAHFDSGAKKVLVSAPCPPPALNLVRGVNDSLYDGGQHDVVTGASCTTNCLAPLVKVMHENLGIRHGSITTIHAITNTQTILDSPHKDLRRARACGESLIPTSTGSAKAIIQIFPELEGRLDGLAVRVPLANPSLTDFVFEAERDTSIDEVNELFRNAAAGELKGVLGVSDRPLVSMDYRHDPRSSVVDCLSTMVINQRQVKVLSWYDNEWGYMNRLMEIAAIMAKQM